jgi:hypothetical protein
LTEAKFFSGVLGMHTNVLRGRWKEISEQVGLKIIEIGEECMRQNVSIEMEVSPLDETTGRKKIVVGTSAHRVEDTTPCLLVQ